LKKEASALRDEISFNKLEEQELKQNLTNILSHAQPQNHFKQLLEVQSLEIVRQKKLIGEYEKREKQCIRKWNTLLSENLNLQEKLGGV